ncbi:hypothetical protein IC235_17605 [Hymenobacter sp. BT664]|uniref:Uncharacterized protein n=1 Tax=Hymenobacter montanus TaxID=2771359 RepID=A0A927BGN0_9BACT|nr:hypothetical protein [Hymenobacter montanus]MBD2769709.1 hypothetical protein [Hymenobacter montanus]
MGNLLIILASVLLWAAVVALICTIVDNLVPGFVRGIAARVAAIFHRAKHQVVRFTRCHGGITITVAALAGWFAYGPILHLFTGDGPDGPALMDVGVFQTILLAIVRAVALYCFSRLLVKRYITPVGRFLFTIRFVRAFYRLTEWQKIIASLWVLSLFVFLATQLTH